MIRRRRIAAALLAGAFAPLRGAAQSVVRPAWPARTLRIIVVYPHGGLSDGIARALGEKLAARLDTTVVVENRAGGGGSLGMEALARAAPDGHTLAFSAVSPLTLKPHLEKVGYDPFKDIEPVAAIMHSPVLLVGTPAFEGARFDDFLRQAKARPGALRWATSGVATAGHLVLEQVRLAAGLDVTHIPYKGGGRQLTDALGGHFELLSTNLAPAQLAYVRSGQFKPLAIGAPERSAALPQVPTFAELGLPQANLTSLFGMFARAGTAPAVLTRLNSEINMALAHPDVAQRLLDTDNLPAAGSRADFAREIAAQWSSNQRLRGLNIRIE